MRRLRTTSLVVPLLSAVVFCAGCSGDERGDGVRVVGDATWGELRRPLIPFAVVVDEVMRRPPSGFPGNPEGVDGRLGQTRYARNSPRLTAAWITQCKNRGLLHDNLQLTERARMLFAELERTT